jgi:hypothetical protein
LIEGGLKVLALDFDLTICSIHTRGVYMGTEEDLNRYVVLITALLFGPFFGFISLFRLNDRIVDWREKYLGSIDELLKI